MTDHTSGHSRELVDHTPPSSAEFTDEGNPKAEVPGTGVMGDETLVRDSDGKGVPGLYPAPPAHTGGAAHPGPGAATPKSNTDSD